MSTKSISIIFTDIFCVVVCILFSVAWMPQSASSAESGNPRMIVISGIVNEQTHAIAKEPLREAYKRIGYQVRFVFVPARRSLEMAEHGESDGDIGRIAGTEEEFPDLVQVPTPIIRFKGIAFAKSVAGNIQSWTDLKGLVTSKGDIERIQSETYQRLLYE